MVEVQENSVRNENIANDWAQQAKKKHKTANSMVKMHANMKQ